MNQFENKFSRIILASQSPRKRFLLSEMGVQFDTISTDTDESFPDHMPAEEVAPYLSLLKAKACHTPQAGELIITCDTTVCLDHKVINKPADAADAVMMLMELSGRTHIVVSGITLTSSDKQLTFSEKTSVTFHPLSKDEIEFYVHNFNPIDKAGAYGIQEWIGYIGVKEIVGCYYNVMGLPLSALYQHLLRW